MMKENSINNWEEMTLKHTNNWMQKKPNDFGQPKKHNEKAEGINNMTRELEGLKEAPKAEIHTDLFKMTLKKISNWKTPGHDGIHGFWFKKITSIHDRLIRYSGPFLKWTRDELKQMDQRTIKLMTMQKALHPRDDIDRLYVSRKEGGKGLASIEDNVDALIQ